MNFLGVGITVLAVLVIGVLVACKVGGDSTNYLVPGRQLDMLLAADSLTAAAVDLNAIMGSTDLTSGYDFGPVRPSPWASPCASCSPGSSRPSP